MSKPYIVKTDGRRSELVGIRVSRWEVINIGDKITYNNKTYIVIDINKSTSSTEVIVEELK